MDIKLIVTDMDGTLLNSSHQLTEYTKEVLIEAQKQGIKLCLASGRSVRTLEGFGKELGMDKHGGYYVCVNGAKITNAQTLETTVLNQLTNAQIKEVMNFTLPYEVEIMAVQDSSIYDYIPSSLMELKKAYRAEKGIADDVPYTAGTFELVVDQRKGYDYIEYLENVNDITVDSNKMCIAHEPENLVQLYCDITRELGHNYNFVKTSHRWIEVAPKGIDKANAVLKVMEVLGVTPSETIVFGDGENDLSMFAVVDYKCAMKNAMDTVKAKATMISEFDNNHDGVANEVKTHIL